MQLKRRRCPFEGHVFAIEAQRVFTLDVELEGRLLLRADRTGEGSVANRVAHRVGTEIRSEERWKDPDHGDPAAVQRGCPTELCASRFELFSEMAERLSREIYVTEIALEVEAIELERHPFVDRFPKHFFIEREWARPFVREGHFELGTYGTRASPETRIFEHCLEHVERRTETFLEKLEIIRSESFAIDFETHD